MEKVPETRTESRKRKPLWKSVLATAVKLLLAAVVIYFAGRQLVNNWAEVSQYHWTINPVLLILSIVFHLITFALFAKTWCVLIKAFNFRVPLKYGFKVAYIADLGRYIPGKIWPVFGMLYVLKQMNINKEVAFASWGMITILSLPPAFLAGFITVSFYPEMLSGTSSVGLGIGPLVAVAGTLAASLVLVFAPNRTMALYNWIVKMLRRPPVQFKLDKKIALQVYLLYFVCWICYGIAFYTFMHAIMDKPEIPVIAGVGSFVMAYLIGYLAFFSPGGLGARELVLTTVLSPFLGPVAAGLAVTARVWNLITEFIAAIIALAIKLETKKE